MKFLIAMSVFAAVATASSIPVDKDALEKELFDLFDLKPREEIDKLFMAYIERDDEFKNFLNYIASEEYSDLIEAFNKVPEAIAFFDYLDESGLKIYDYIKILNNGAAIQRLLPSEKSADKEVEITGGLNGLAEDIAKITPFEEIEKLHGEKMRSSLIYAYFIGRITSHEFSKLTVSAIFTTEFLTVLESMDNAKVDVTALKKLFCLNVGIRNC